MEILVLLSTLLAFAAGLENSCNEKCNRSFPLHTYPKKELHFACMRGCRLERIDQVYERTENSAEKTCEDDCETAYHGNTDSKNACVIGCKAAWPGLPTQAAMLKEESKKVSFYALPRSAIHPLLVIRRYCSGLYSVAVSYVGIDTAVVVKDGRAINMEIEVKGSPQYWHIESVNSKSEITVSEKEEQSVRLHITGATTSSWLDCVAYKAGVPKWLLGGALFVSLTSIIYLCCCSCCDSASSDEKSHSFDNVFTVDAENMLKLPLYTDEQASPLPPKYSEKGGIL